MPTERRVSAGAKAACAAGAVAAGAAAGAVQASGAAARLLWAMLADRLRSSALVLVAVGFGTAAYALAMPFALHWTDGAVLLLLSRPVKRLMGDVR